MKKHNFFGLLLILLTSTYALTACSNKKAKNISSSSNIVITEVMPSNRTGLLLDDRPVDWIEIKNMEADTVNIEGLTLALLKTYPDSLVDGKPYTEEKRWEFPSGKISPGENIVIFADKKKGKKADKGTLVADFNLPKEGGILKLLSPDGSIVYEVEYPALSHDISWASGKDGSYTATNLPTPGFDNTPEGYEAALKEIDSQRGDPLKIWEVMSHEQSDPNWIELKNTGDSDIDLSEYSIAKKFDKKEAWQLPAKTLKPGEFIVFQFMGRKARRNKPEHLPFKLGKSETVVLMKGDRFIDGVNSKPTVKGSSIGRSAGESGFLFFNTPTRQGENGKGKRYIAAMPEFDLKPGFYADKDTICLRLKNPGGKVHYTLNGSRPTSSSPVFKDSLLITKNTTIRAFAEEDSIHLKSDVATMTYLPGASHDVAVVNITVNPGDLYNHADGIYADGPGYTTEWPHKGANYWKKWTKNAHVEFIDGKEGFSTDCGLMIFGGFSRAEPKKSFRLKFRSEFGAPGVEYDFFDDGNPLYLEDVVLRAGGQDYSRCMLRDEFFTSLMKEHSPNILTQLYRPVALYLNGQYFGMYYLREKIDRNFVARKLNVPDDSISILAAKTYVEAGSKADYDAILNYLQSHDIHKKETYEYIKDRINVEGLIDYKLGQIYSGNSDAGNVRYVRSASEKSDKKWHFVFYDLDATWVGHGPKAEFYLTNGVKSNGADVTSYNILINRLLNNKEFRAHFLQRLSHHLTNTFSPSNATSVFDNIVAQIQNEMKNDCDKWDHISYDKWQKNIDSFRSRFETRPKEVLDDLRSFMKITPEEEQKYFSHLGY